MKYYTNKILKRIGNIKEKAFHFLKINKEKLLLVCVKSVTISLFFALLLPSIVPIEVGNPYSIDEMQDKIEVVVEIEDNTEDDENVVEEVVATISPMKVDKLSASLDGRYVGFVSKELLSLNIELKGVDGVEELFGEQDGNIYSQETQNVLASEFSSLVSIDGVEINIQNIEHFEQLDSDEKFTKDYDLNGDFYVIKNEENVKFLTRGVQSVLTGSEDIFYAFFMYVNDYESCKDLQASVLDGVTIDSTITDVVRKLGKPNVVDVYEIEGQPPYALCYYENEEKTRSISLVFEQNKEAKNGYYLSEVTITMIEAS